MYMLFIYMYVCMNVQTTEDYAFILLAICSQPWRLTEQRRSYLALTIPPLIYLRMYVCMYVCMYIFNLCFLE